jgi:hypothetical protein
VDFYRLINLTALAVDAARVIAIFLFFDTPLPLGSIGIITLARNSPQNPQPKGLRGQNPDNKGLARYTVRAE